MRVPRVKEDTMSRLLGIVFIYAAMILAWTGVGLFMLVAPVRFGNLIHDRSAFSGSQSGRLGQEAVPPPSGHRITRLRGPTNRLDRS